MYDFLSWAESSALGTLIRASGPWAYGLINLAHILGIASLFGAVLILDLRLLGLWRRADLATITRVTSPVAAAGFALAATSGAGLLSTNATEYTGNPFLLVKFPVVALGFVNAVAVRRTRAWREHAQRALSRAEQRQLAVMGGISLCSWLTAIAAGRMIGYW